STPPRRGAARSLQRRSRARKVQAGAPRPGAARTAPGEGWSRTGRAAATPLASPRRIDAVASEPRRTASLSRVTLSRSVYLIWVVALMSSESNVRLLGCGPFPYNHPYAGRRSRQGGPPAGRLDAGRVGEPVGDATVCDRALGAGCGAAGVRQHARRD